MATASSLPDEEEIDENHTLVTFFQERDYFLRTIKLAEVPPKLKYEVAILFFITSKDAEWMEFLYELGLDYISINAIDCKSRCGIPPLFVAFTIMREKTFGQIMEVFSRKEKFHILQHVKPFVESLLLRKQNLMQPSAPLLPDPSAVKEPYQEPLENKETDSSQHQARISNADAHSNHKLKVKIPAKDSSILVFIQHAMSDKTVAVELASAFHKRGFRVLLSADVLPLLRINHAQILKAINEKVDFIVPLLSDEFLKQINFRKGSIESECDFETGANLFLYDLALHQYSNSLKNYRIRPVFISLKCSAHIEKDPILSKPFHLWNEVSLLFKNLEITKAYF